MNVVPFPRYPRRKHKTPTELTSTKVTTTHGCGWKLTTTGPDAVDKMLAALEDHAQDCPDEPT